MTTLSHPSRRPATPRPTLAEATARLRGTVERATRDRSHQAKNGTLIVGARALDLIAVLDAVDLYTTAPETNTANPEPGEPFTL